MQSLLTTASTGLNIPGLIGAQSLAFLVVPYSPNEGFEPLLNASHLRGMRKFTQNSPNVECYAARRPQSVPPGGVPITDTAFRWSSKALVCTVWISATLFGLYIVAFYVGALADGQLARWNQNLPGLYAPHSPAATSGLGLHFLAGRVILILGCIQLIGSVRTRWPALHRWLGRVYLSAALLAGLGGLTFILVVGTIGGPIMNVDFGLYGVLMVLTAVQTYRYARARSLQRHRAWALRLFTLAIGSWLFRMDYGFWLLLSGGWGSTDDFRGPFDHVMAFFFYPPNLLIVEAFIRSKHAASPQIKLAAAVFHQTLLGSGDPAPPRGITVVGSVPDLV
jgi:Predicted membrane protein (DUF2306)